MREVEIEKKVSAYAVSRGWLSKKMTIGEGFPDRLFIRAGRFLLVEFKAPGKKLRPLQELAFKILKHHGVTAHMVDNIERGKELINAYTIPDERDTTRDS